jgi:hypothetical protein
MSLGRGGSARGAEQAQRDPARGARRYAKRER